MNVINIKIDALTVGLMYQNDAGWHLSFSINNFLARSQTTISIELFCLSFSWKNSRDLALFELKKVPFFVVSDWRNVTINTAIKIINFWIFAFGFSIFFCLKSVHWKQEDVKVCQLPIQKISLKIPVTSASAFAYFLCLKRFPFVCKSNEALDDIYTFCIA